VSPAALVETLRARGVTLEVHGDRLKVRPATAVTPDEVEKLRQHKTEVLRLLAPAPAATPVSLDRVTIREVLGPDTDDPHAVACVRFEVVATVRELKAGIRAGCSRRGALSTAGLCATGSASTTWRGCYGPVMATPRPGQNRASPSCDGTPVRSWRPFHPHAVVLSQPTGRRVSLMVHVVDTAGSHGGRLKR
jgi:TubC N-terminal docking domain